jgi:hypothetical protein
MMRRLLSFVAVTALIVGSGCKTELPASVKGANRPLDIEETPREFSILSVVKDGREEAYAIRYQVANLGKNPLLHLGAAINTEGIYRDSQGDLPSWTSKAELGPPQAKYVVVLKPSEIKELTVHIPVLLRQEGSPALSVRLVLHPWSMASLEGGYPKKHWTQSMTWPKQKLVSQELDLKTGKLIPPPADQ